MKARGSSGGRKLLEVPVKGLKVPFVAERGLGGASLGEARMSLPFSKRAPPSVAHFRMVWIRWFCFRGFDRYSSICAWIHFSRSPSIACAVSAMMGVRCVPRFRSYSRILAVASNPPCLIVSWQSSVRYAWFTDHNWHLNIHEDDVVSLLLDGIKCFLSVTHNSNYMMVFLKNLHCQSLIDYVIFC